MDLFDKLQPKKWPWEAADYDADGRIVYAVRALSEGKATDAQQKVVWEWMMYLTGAGERWQDLSFRYGPDGSRATDFAEGKRFVGLQLRKMLHPAVTPQAAVEPKRR